VVASADVDVEPGRRPTGAEEDPVTRRARRAVAAIFFVNGALFANWVARVPAVKDRIGAGPGALGLALLGLAAGAVVTMPLAGRLCERLGSDTVVRLGTLAASVVLVGPALAPSAPALGAGLALYGGSFGLMDVAMNVQAVAVIRRLERPIMPWFHAAFSLGGLAGAGTGALAAQVGLSPLAHFALAGAACAGVLLAAHRHLLPDGREGRAGSAAEPVEVAGAGAAARRDGAPTDPAGEPVGPAGDRVPAATAGRSDGPSGDTGPTRRARPPRRRRSRQEWLFLVGLGALAASAALGEGAMADWTALFLRDVTGTGAGVAALGFAAFAVMMTAGRLGGEAAVRRLGPVRLLRLGGLAGTSGVLLAVVAGSTVAGLVGFGLVGLGFSCAFPLALTAAGESSDGSGGDEIAAVSVFGYLGFLVGPPFIGLLAEVVELRWAMLAVAGSTLGIAVLAGVVGRAPAAAAEGPVPAAVDRDPVSRPHGLSRQEVYGDEHDRIPGIPTVLRDATADRCR
jgi:MFS family permease